MPTEPRRGRAWGRLLLSFGLTGLFGWWAFHDLNWADMWASLRTANFLWLVPHVVMLQCVHWLRVLRWGSLLSGLERVRFRALNASTAVGNMLFVLLPLTPWADPGARVNWPAALAIAVGAVLGAQLGGRVGRRLPPLVYRVVIVVVGVAAIIGLLLD